MEAALHIMSYLKHKHNSRLVLDPSYAVIDYGKFKKKEDWTEFYGNVKEAVPPNAPKPLGKEVELRMFVDSDHAGDKATRRSRTGFMIYVNMSSVLITYRYRFPFWKLIQDICYSFSKYIISFRFI